MKSLKVKLVSIVSAFILALSLLVVGVWAVGQSQTITMEGSVNFNVADKSLYVKDVRMQESMASQPYSLKEGGEFIPGFINTSFSMDLGDFVNNYGSFALYFDIINTREEQTGETVAYSIEQITTPSNATASVTVLDTNGKGTSKIPEGTVKPSEITSETPISATIKLIITSTPSTQVDLSEITITIIQFIPEVYDYFDFEVDEQTKTATLTSFNESLVEGKTDIVIPASISKNIEEQWIEGNAYTVESIGEFVFQGCTGLTSITLPSSLTSVGNFAFEGCDSLTNIDLSNCKSLTSIGERAFSFCRGLTTVELAQCTDLTSIEPYAFDNCWGLENITLPSSVTSIGVGTFSSCTSLTSITLPEGLASIGDYAFQACSSLTSITLPEGLISIGDGTFDACSGLTGTVTIPASVNEIGANPFRSCNNLEGIAVESGNSEYYIEGNCLIEESTKTLITGLKNSTIPSDIKIIVDYAFFDCDGLTSITLPSSLTSIGESAFRDCDGLKEVIIDSKYVYTNATSKTACGDLFSNSSITTVKVLTRLVQENHAYINSTNFPNEIRIEGEYTVYSK